MNFLSHAVPYIDQPLVAISTGIPDWLGMVDRKIRARANLARPHLDSDDSALRQVAQGIIHHVEDDRWFHGTQAFVETNLEFAVQLRDLLPGDHGFRPMFVGHILIEMCLDALWIRDDRDNAERYYEAISAQSWEAIQSSVNVITGKPTERLTEIIGRFVEVQFLYDYLDPQKLLFRLNQVMKRVRLSPLPESVGRWLPAAEKLVESRRTALLTPPDGSDPFALVT